MLGCCLAAAPAAALAANEPDPSPRAPAVAAAAPAPAASDAAARRALREARSKHRAAHARARAKAGPKPVAVPPALQAIAQCESGGNPRAIGGGGLYRGKYQFSVETWAAVGGKGDPAAAPEAEQDRRAIILYERSGPGQWPVCGS
jgi:transglycosylase-like protein